MLKQHLTFGSSGDYISLTKGSHQVPSERWVVPRRYRMQARSRSVAETRSRIIRAATELHTERGVVATSWEEIAERAEVAPATVYRHFPSLVDLVPACARSVFDIIRPPTLEEADAKFVSLPSPLERLEVLIRDSCHCYSRGEGWLHAARRERDLPACPSRGRSNPSSMVRRSE